jgi:hypothetical protein
MLSFNLASAHSVNSFSSAEFLTHYKSKVFQLCNKKLMLKSLTNNIYSFPINFVWFWTITSNVSAHGNSASTQVVN